MSNAMDHFRSDTDAAASTSAQARRLADELDQLRRDYNSVLLERNVAWSQLANAEQIIRAAHERAEAARSEQPRASNRARAYQLTDKGLAATEETHG